MQKVEKYLVPWAADNGGKDSPRGVISCKASFAHSRAVVNDQSSCVFVTHFVWLFFISLGESQVGRQLLTEWTFQLPRGFYSPGFSYAWEKSPERLPYKGIESLFSVLSYGEIFLTVLEKLIGAESLAFLEPFKPWFFKSHDLKAGLTWWNFMP